MTAAERLFAEHGLDGVSFGQIRAAIGNGNKSVVQYHFDSKDQLVQAIFEFRLPDLHERRARLITERPDETLQSWMACQLRAIMEQAEIADCYYLRFVAMLRLHNRRDVFERIPPPLLESTRSFYEVLRSKLPDLTEPQRTYRITQAMTLIMQAASDRERARGDGKSPLPFALETTYLLDATIGLLLAPISPFARVYPNDPGVNGLTWPPFL